MSKTVIPYPQTLRKTLRHRYPVDGRVLLLSLPFLRLSEQERGGLNLIDIWRSYPQDRLPGGNASERHRSAREFEMKGGLPTDLRWPRNHVHLWDRARPQNISPFARSTDGGFLLPHPPESHLHLHGAVRPCPHPRTAETQGYSA